MSGEVQQIMNRQPLREGLTLVVPKRVQGVLPHPSGYLILELDKVQQLQSRQPSAEFLQEKPDLFDLILS